MPIAITAAMGAALASCSSNDPEPVEIDFPEKTGLEVTGQTPNSLDFSWQSIKSVNQYGYELYHPDGTKVIADVTQNTYASFTDLEQNTLYTLKVYAYAPIPGNQSAIYTLQAKTGSQIPLATPANLNAVIESNGDVTVSFESVEHADYYQYELTSSLVSQSGEWTETTNTLTGLSTDTYTLTVVAHSYDSEYCMSGAATTQFTLEQTMLATPANLVISQDVSYSAETYIDFDAVPNADYYRYTVSGSESLSGEFYSNQNNLLILPGECTISITAVSNNALFMESTPATATYTVQKGEVGIPTINSVTVNADGVLTVDLTPGSHNEYYYAYVLCYNTDVIHEGYLGDDLTFTIPDYDGGKYSIYLLPWCSDTSYYGDSSGFGSWTPWFDFE